MVHRCRAANCSDLFRIDELVNRMNPARWTVPSFKFYMCTGVVNVSSTAWLGMAFISMLSKRTTNLIAMSPKLLKYCSMDVKPKYNTHVPIL